MKFILKTLFGIVKQTWILRRVGSYEKFSELMSEIIKRAEPKNYKIKIKPLQFRSPIIFPHGISQKNESIVSSSLEAWLKNPHSKKRKSWEKSESKIKAKKKWSLDKNLSASDTEEKCLLENK